MVHLEIVGIQARLDLLVNQVARKVRKENLGSLERGENPAKMVNQATLDFEVKQEIRVFLVDPGEMVQKVTKVIEDLLDLQDMISGHSQAKDQKEILVILDHLVLKGTEELQVFKDHLAHKVNQDLEVQDHPDNQVYLEREERRVMKDGLDSPIRDHLAEQVLQVPRDSKGLLVLQEYLTVMWNVSAVLLDLKA